MRNETASGEVRNPTVMDNIKDELDYINELLNTHYNRLDGLSYRGGVRKDKPCSVDEKSITNDDSIRSVIGEKIESIRYIIHNMGDRIRELEDFM